jgi:hypothetical protein
VDLAFLVIVVLIVLASGSLRLWLALAFAAWCVVGFVLARESWRAESPGVALVDALTAPFGLLLYSPFMLLRAKDACTLRKLRAEIERIGADDARVDGIYDRRTKAAVTTLSATESAAASAPPTAAR